MKKLLLLFTLISSFYLQAQVVNIPDANFKAKLLQASSTNMIASTQNPDANGFVTSYNSIDTNSDGEIQISEAQAIKFLDVNFSNINDITGIESFMNLKFLNCDSNHLTNINLSGLTNLQQLLCNSNDLVALNLNALLNLEVLICTNNEIQNLDLPNSTNLQILYCQDNLILNLDLNGLSNLQKLICSNNQIPSLNLSGLSNLQILYCSNNQIPSLNLSLLSNLKILDCSNNPIPTLNLTNLINLQQLICSNNLLTNLDLANQTNLLELNCNNNQISNLNLINLINLEGLYCTNNIIQNLNLNGLNSLKRLSCSYNLLNNLDLNNLSLLESLNCNNNQISNLNCSNLVNLKSIRCGVNQLINLNLSGCTKIISLNCGTNFLTELNLAELTKLSSFYCQNNLLASIDLSNSPQLTYLSCANNELITLFIKNNSSSVWQIVDFNDNPNLSYVCADEADLTYFQNKVNSYGYGAACSVNSYCNFTPGGVFYTINGLNKLDGNNNGCDITDNVYPNLKFTIINGTITGSITANTSGSYFIPVSTGTHTITPQFENPSYFTVSPASASITFPTTTSPFIQDFCVTPNGTHHDLEVVIIPLVPARPGFDATYKIKYKNKGTVSENTTLAFNYDDMVLDFVTSTLAPNSQTTGNISWNIGAISPFQSGEIEVTLNVNSPTETPAVNTGDVLNYSAIMNGLNTDETPIDNTFSLNQTVVNSYDPNDKTCLEGSSINPIMIGEYIHYKIRFENTGTFSAQNIVVKDMIDTANFDLSTLQMTDASHNCVTRISNPNKVEFIFENINLPFDDATNDGYVVFKIKTKNTLVVGNTISNSANIYFDYNFPIVTNTATSTFQVLQNDSFVFDTYFSIYPNPTQDVLNLKTKQDVIIYSLSIYSILCQQMQTTTNPEKTIDVSGLASGNYFIKIVTDKGISNTKFIKQ